MTIDINPEFGIELVLATPYIYWLHTQNKLTGVNTATDMTPFYYFCNNINEKYNYRTVDNGAAGLNALPNNWLHHNENITNLDGSRKNGVLDYSQWTPPPLKKQYKNDRFIFDSPLVIINNSYNIEANTMPTRYFSIECLYEMFNYLNEKNYTIIYRRPRNSDLPSMDQNEYNTINKLGDISADVEGVGNINDYQLTQYFENVILFDDLIKQNPDLSYNTLQCMLYANCDKFISYVGGAGILSSYFDGTNIMWLSRGKEIRDGYFCKDSYYKKLSNCNIITIRDKQETFPHSIENYSELLKTIKTTF
jgi:hypothetical protein